MNLNLMQGNCLELMKEIPDGSVDLVLTDPPYGTTACKWDSVIPFEPMWTQLKRVTVRNGAIVLFSSQPFTSALTMSNVDMFKYEWVWDKKMSVGFLNAKKLPLRRHENILVFGSGVVPYYPQMRKGEMRNKSPKRKSDNYDGRAYGKISHKGDNFNDQYYPTSIIEESNANRKNRVHPTQKPVPLLEYLIKTYTNEGETVLDFTMGSGTTGVAAKNLNRNFIGIELDEEYFNIAKERILK